MRQCDQDALFKKCGETIGPGCGAEMSTAKIYTWDANYLFIMVRLGEWKTVNSAAWKGGEVKVCDGLQVLEPFYNSTDLNESWIIIF